MKYSQDGITYDEIYIKALDSMPIGSIISFAGENIPTGWLVCDGDVVSSTDYPDLFAEIGNKYGGTSPSFKLPDLRGRVPVGLDPTDQLEDFDILGNKGGSRTDNLSNAYAKVGRSSADYNVLQYKSKGGVSDTFDRKLTATGNVIGGSSNTITDATELGGSVSTLQPYLVVNFIIKAKSTTPTMASVVNATNDSTEDSYSCNYVNDRYEGTILYNTNNGTYGDVPLSDDVSNYRYLEIYYTGAHTYGSSSMKIDLSVDNRISLISFSSSSNSATAYFAGVIYSANGSTLSFISSKVFRTDSGTDTGNIICVHKVIGYK